MPNKKKNNYQLMDGLVLILLIGLVIISKAQVLSFPEHWDEGPYIEPSDWLSQGSLLRAFPGHHPPEMFFGHPPLLYLILAATIKAGFNLLTASRIFAISFAAMALCYTYLLGRILLNRTAAVMAALFLFATPLFFAQAGLYQGDMPITALGIMTVYYALRKNIAGYLICGILMVLSKETSVAIIVAVMIYVCFEESSWSGRFKRLCLYAIPGFVLGAFFLWQKAETGQFVCNPYFAATAPFMVFSPSQILYKAHGVVGWIFAKQNREILTFIIFLNILISGRTAWKREYALFGCILTFFLMAFSSIFFLYRYVLAVLPYYCLMGAVSLQGIAKGVFRQCLIAFFVLALFWSQRHEHESGYGLFDEDMQYTDIIHINQQLCQTLEKEFSDSLIYSIWPVDSIITVPHQGYVSAPLKLGTEEHFDVLVYVRENSASSQKLKETIRREGLVLYREFTKNHKIIDIYLTRELAGQKGALRKTGTN